MVVGNFSAIFGSIVLAIYMVYSVPLLKEESFPFYTFMVLSSLCVAVYSWLLSWIFNNPVEILSFEAKNGVFGIFSNRY